MIRGSLTKYGSQLLELAKGLKYCFHENHVIEIISKNDHIYIWSYVRNTRADEDLPFLHLAICGNTYSDICTQNTMHIPSQSVLTERFGDADLRGDDHAGSGVERALDGPNNFT